MFRVYDSLTPIPPYLITRPNTTSPHPHILLPCRQFHSIALPTTSNQLKSQPVYIIIAYPKLYYPILILELTCCTTQFHVCSVPGKQSTASTVPETDDAALSNALQGLKLQKALEMGSPPVTPPAQIRRNNTPRQVLEGSIGDVPILGGGHDGTDSSSRTKGSCPTAMKKVKKHASKKSKKGAKNSRQDQERQMSQVKNGEGNTCFTCRARDCEAKTCSEGRACGARVCEARTCSCFTFVSMMERLQQQHLVLPKHVLMSRCPNTSVPIPKANVPAALELVKKEEKEIPRLPGLKTTTPTSVRMAKAVDQSLDENLARAATQELCEPSELGNGTEYYSPGYSPSHASLAGSEMGNDEEGELGSDYDEFLNSLNDGKDEEAQDSRDSDQVSVAETTKTSNTQKKKKKGKKEKTPLQKAMHARYMKFSRSIRSN